MMGMLYRIQRYFIQFVGELELGGEEWHPPKFYTIIASRPTFAPS
jgi:hypothetical protein